MIIQKKIERLHRVDLKILVVLNHLKIITKIVQIHLKNCLVPILDIICKDKVVKRSIIQDNQII